MAKSTKNFWWLAGNLVAVLLPLSAIPASACDMCGPPQATLTQEIRGAYVAVVARLVALPPETESSDGSLNVAPRMAKFAVVEVLRGAAALGSIKQIEAPFFDEQPLGGEYLIYGSQSSDIEWGAPLQLSPRSRRYLADSMILPPQGPERLAYFQNYLEDPESLLGNDAFNEFAQAPYAQVQQLKGRMHRDTLIRRVQDPMIAPNHRRLYLTMLGVCGGPADLPVLEELIRNDDPKFRISLDATVACYLTLKGADGLELVEDLFLKPKVKAEYSEVSSVIIALRFIGQQEHGPIPRARLIESLRLVLADPRVADQALMDLARWQDWTVIDRVAEMFKSTDKQTASFVRVPAINYLRACPLPRAKTLVEELRKIDPSAVASSEEQYAIAGQAASATPPAAYPANAPPAASDTSGSQSIDAGPPPSSSEPHNPLNLALLVAGAAIGGATLLAMVVRGKAKPFAGVNRSGE